MPEKHYYVYMPANRRGDPLYTGVTSNLFRRMFEHREGLIEGFTKKYWIKKLVYYEVHATAPEAICREKCIKKWNRAWKNKLIEKENPEWKDLYETISR